MNLPEFDPAELIVEDQRGLPPPEPEGFLDIMARGIRRGWEEGDPIGIKALARKLLPGDPPTIAVPRFRGPGYQVTLPKVLPQLRTAPSKAELDRAYK